jgi:hypothetical protein
MLDIFKKKNKLPDNVVPFPKEPEHGEIELHFGDEE